MPRKVCGEGGDEYIRRERRRVPSIDLTRRKKRKTLLTNRYYRSNTRPEFTMSTACEDD